MTSDQLTMEEVLIELNRELCKRREVYPRWVKDGKLSARVAEKRCLSLVMAIDFIEKHYEPDQQTLGFEG